MKSLNVITLFIISFLNAELTHYERGVQLYEKRANKAQGLKANTEFIDQAINEFLKGYKTSGSELNSGIYLLRCYYYKGKFVAKDDQKKKEFFNQGKALGEKLIKLYPKDVGAYYWYLVNLGSWSEVYGILSAAKEGVANTMRDYSTKIIDIDPNYSDGGGYLNAALRWSFVESLYLELDLNNLLFDDEKVEYFKREIKITYIEYF